MNDQSKIFLQDDHNHDPDYNHDHDYDHDHDTLSLSDLPTYSQDYHSDFPNTISSNDFCNDSFEFYKTNSQSQSYPRIDNIIFCGKSISCKETPKLSQLNAMNYSSSKKKWGLKKCSSKEKVSKMKYWCLLVFGLQRFTVPTKMELDDMKFRQSKKSPKSIGMLEKSNSGKVEKGLSYLIRSLSCKTNNFVNVLD